MSASIFSSSGTNVNVVAGAGSLITFDWLTLTQATSSAQLIIRAKDVDYGLSDAANTPYAVGDKRSEWDGVYIQKQGASSWAFVGYLNGTNNNWSYTTFDVSSFLSSGGAGSYAVRVVPDDDGTHSQKSNGGVWTVVVPSAEIYLGGDKAIEALSARGQSVSSTWKAEVAGSYTIQYLLIDGAGRAVAQVNANVTASEAGVSQTNTVQLAPNSNFYTAWSQLPEGSYTLQATLLDASGIVRGVKNAPITYDFTAPTVALSAAPDTVGAGAQASITLTISEEPVGLILDDLTCSGGTLSDLVATTDPKVYRVTFHPSADFDGVANVGIAAGSYSDASGNAGAAGSVAGGLRVDTLAPTVQLASSASMLKAGQAADITLTFSEAPIGLALSDLSCSSGTLSALAASADPKVFHVTFTPAANFDGTARVDIAAGSYTDAAGNAGMAGSLTAGLRIDSLAPKVQLSSSASALRAGQTADITLAFSEVPVGFTLSDLRASSGTLSGLTATADPKVFHTTYTPAANFEGTADIGIAAGSYTDGFGNGGDAGSLMAALRVDTLSPTLKISASQMTLKAGSVSTLTFTFSEAPVGFTLADVTATHGTVRNLKATSNPLVFSAELVPEKAYVGPASVQVGAGSYTDAALNAGSGDVLAGITIAKHLVSLVDFENIRTPLSCPSWVDVSGLGGLWQTDNRGNALEVGRQTIYGARPDKAAQNNVMELVADSHDASDFYSEFYAASGTQVTMSFDYSARKGAVSDFEVLWGGKVIDTVHAGSTFQMMHKEYTLNVATTGLQCFELHGISKNGCGAVIDNVAFAATQVTASAKDATMSVLDFQSENLYGTAWQNLDLLNNQGWFTDNGQGRVEVGLEQTYGGRRGANKVIELAANPGDKSNLYTNLMFEQGSHIQFSFDVSARSNHSSKVLVLWDGKVIDTVDAGRSFDWKHHSYDLLATGQMQRLEVQAVSKDSYGAVLDNLVLATHALV